MRDLLRRRLGVVVAVVVLAVLVLSSRLAGFAVDLWWFDAVGYRDVFVTILSTRALVGLVGAVVLGVVVAVNLHIARRMRPLFIPTTPQQAQVERYRELVDPYLPWIIGGISLLFAASSGLALSLEWDTVLLWRNSVPVGVDDPQFGKDVGFYLFDLPFWTLIQEWLLTSLVLTTLLTVGAHYLLGGIRPENPGDKVMPNVKAHLSALFALVLAAWGWGYWLDRYLLNYSPRGTVTGASYTDVTAELRALEILVVVSVLAIGLVLYNLRKRGFLLPGTAVALLVVGSIFLQGAYPAAIQRFQVEPQELARERPYIERNLEATRAAYGLDEVELRPFAVTNDLDSGQADENTVTLSNIRLWDDQLLSQTYAELQALRPYYQFADVDVDRYEIDGELRQVMLSTRDMDQDDLPAGAQNWQNEVLTYTHGFGVVASQVNTATDDGQPVFIAEDIPPTGNADVLVPDTEPGIYYGAGGNRAYNIVNTEQPELDYEEPGTQQQVTTSYSGAGGVALSSLLRRLAFAIEYGDSNIVLSNLIRDDSQLLRLRTVAERVKEVAPYLLLDDDPYPVVIEGRVVWIQDAYTASSRYPYSEFGQIDTAEGQQRINYVRNSVKAVVDAYDGTVRLFTVDPDDPVLEAWSNAFPGTFEPLDALPDGLDEHFRFPQDLFELQSELYRTYHIPGPDAFFSKADEWALPPDAAFAVNNPNAAEVHLEPYYLLMRLPGQTDEEFVLIQPYHASGRDNMVAWLAARSDPENYGELFAVQFPTDQQILGTGQVQARIEQEDEIANYITVRSREGSTVVRGNMLVLPIERSIVYVEPLFLQGDQSNIPELARVVLVMGQRVVFEECLTAAIAELVRDPLPPDACDALARGEQIEDVGDGEPSDDPTEGQPDDDASDDQTGDGTGSPLPLPEGVDQGLLIQALEAFAAAEEALAAGNLGEYQRLVGEAQDFLERALAQAGLDPDDLDAPAAGATEADVAGDPTGEPTTDATATEEATSSP